MSQASPTFLPRATSLALLLSGAAMLLSAPASPAQQGAVTFKHFKRYPQGQWQQTGQGYRNGAPIGEPVTSTNCTAPLSPASVAAVKSFGNAAAPECTTHVITDTESTAEYEQVCDLPGGTQVNHMTMHAVDDKTITNETHMSINGREMAETRSTVRYLGACTAPPVGAMPAVPKPSAEDCAEIADMRKQAQDALKSCATMPPADRLPNCEATMQRAVKQTDTLAAACH